MTTHEPASRIVTVFPAIEHTAAEVESIANTTDAPEDDVADNVNGSEATLFAPGSEIEIVAG